MKILFLSISTAVKDLQNRGIYPDLINHFIAQGHELFIVCPLERRLKTDTFLKKENRVTTLGVKTYNITKSNFIEKGIATILIERQFDKAIRKHLTGQTFDLILYTTPPITFNSLIRKLKIKHHAKTYLLLKDIFPQNAVDLGLMKKGSLLYSYFRKKEEMLYSISDHIGCMSEANVAYVLKNNPEVSKQKVEICPNSIRVTERNPDLSKTEFLKKYNIPENIPIFLYGGNLGIGQGIEFLIKVLESNKNRLDCFIIIVGSGNRYHLIQNWIDEMKPNNVRLMSHIHRNEYDVLEFFCDVGMVFLDKKFTIPNFPSRILSYMECKMPLLIATDSNTDLGLIATQNNFGLWSISDDVEQFNTNLNYFIHNKEIRSTMGNNAYNFLKENYDVSINYKVIMNHFNEKV